jgi:hypothetical protein
MAKAKTVDKEVAAKHRQAFQRVDCSRAAGWQPTLEGAGAATLKGVSPMTAAGHTELEWQVRRIPLDAIQVDPTVQQRAAGTSQDVVYDYAETMRNGIVFTPIDAATTINPFILPTAWPIDRRIPTPKISNVGFTPATVTTHFSLPAARTRSTDCRAAARTRRKPSRRSSAASDGRGGVIARSPGNAGSRIHSSPRSAVNIWKRFQMPTPSKRLQRRLPRRLTPPRRFDDAPSGAAADVTI